MFSLGLNGETLALPFVGKCLELFTQQSLAGRLVERLVLVACCGTTPFWNTTPAIMRAVTKNAEICVCASAVAVDMLSTAAMM